MILLFSSTIFVSAILVFFIQPMFSKMALPILGGAPAVWNTCMVFYQAALLAGYGYAHAAIECLGVRRQAVLHLGLMLLPFFTLPIAIPEDALPPAESNPAPWLLLLLAGSIGLPFFMVSSSAPMLQRWFADMGLPSSKDPYFLYSASNAGSMIGLLGYPLLLEPNLRLTQQSILWAWGYGFLLLLTAACALAVRYSREETTQPEAHTPPDAEQEADDRKVTGKQRCLWLAWSFAPSSLLLGVTTSITIDISPIPLLWIVPLTIYLFTFILVFARYSARAHQRMTRTLRILLLPVVLLWLLQIGQPLWLVIMLHLSSLFVAAMACHGRLALSRPPTRYLTEFYLWLALGGVLGGLFNSFLAPLLFTNYLEYPVVLVLATILSGDAAGRKVAGQDFVLPAMLAIGLIALSWTLYTIGIASSQVTLPLLFGAPAVALIAFRDRPVRFGLGIVALMIATNFYWGADRTLYADRSFFGVYRVSAERNGKYHSLKHGSTTHGIQSLDTNRRREPLSYYHRTGPIGDVFRVLRKSEQRLRVGIVGLGTGSLACYGQRGEVFVFFEIDPLVEKIARDERYFSYLSGCPPKTEVILGDARISLAKSADPLYDLMILDAFSSDAIPVHLLTREAIELYLTRLSLEGMLAFHISNRYLDLAPTLMTTAASLGLIALERNESKIEDRERENGKRISRWLVMARHPEDLRRLSKDLGWKPPDRGSDAAPWTDDFSNILPLVRWK